MSDLVAMLDQMNFCRSKSGWSGLDQQALALMIRAMPMMSEMGRRAGRLGGLWP